jgi:predicted dehydrogenase
VAAALAAGKHVLAEKPLVGTEKEAADLVEQARAAGRTLMENIAFLLHGQHRAVRAVQDAEQLGELRVFSSAFGIPPLRPGNIRYRPELGGGALLDVGFYPLRAAQLFLGPDLRVIGAELRTGAAGVDVAGSVLLAAPGGASVQLSFGFEHFYRNEYELWCSAGRVGLTRAFTPPPEHRPALRIERDGRVETRSLAPEDQFGHLARVFATVVTNRADLRAHHEDVIAHARLLDAVRAHTGMAGR